MKNNSNITKIIIILSLATFVLFVSSCNVESTVQDALANELQGFTEALPTEARPPEAITDEPSPEQTDTIDDLNLLRYYSFTELDDGSYGMSLCPENTSLVSITIPQSFRGKPVTRIMEGGFKDCQSLTSLDLSGIQFIEASAFENCKSLKTVTFPMGLGYIGPDAFAGCSSLSSVKLGTVERLEANVFSNCTSLRTITLAGNIKSVGENFSFGENLEITNVILEGGMLTPRMFKNFIHLTEIDLSNLGYIPQSSFFGCSNLSNVRLGEKVYLIDDAAFANCTSLQKISIPKSVQSIGEGIFEGSVNLKEINYAGTLSDWGNIDKHENWDANTAEYIIYCTDGSILKYNDSENA